MVSETIKIVEVGPRDGLQNEATILSTDDKVAFVERLAACGLTQIEVSSFVAPRAVPQLADADDVFRRLPKAPQVTYSALVPNARGLERALDAGVRRVAVFAAASETFSRKNINLGIEQSLEMYREVIADALSAGVSVRGYLSTCFVCPYEGDVPPERVTGLTERLLEMGVDQVAISDTVGAASPKDIVDTVSQVLLRAPVGKIALHLHDTYGTALANVFAGLQLGVRTFDASVGGLGGCPYAPGAAGNLATEDLVYMLERMGHRTGVKLDRLNATARWIGERLGTELTSRQARN